jgi:PAS domain S-box-containing protein
VNKCRQIFVKRLPQAARASRTIAAQEAFQGPFQEPFQGPFHGKEREEGLKFNPHWSGLSSVMVGQGTLRKGGRRALHTGPKRVRQHSKPGRPVEVAFPPSPELKWIYDTAPIGLAFLSPDCRYLQINQRLTDICGISVEDHLGQTVREMVPNIAPQVEKLVQSIVENGEPVTGIEVTGQRADGIGADRSWVTSWYPLKSPDGRVLGVNVAAEEITERKRAEAAVAASEKRYRALVSATTSIVWTATPDGQFIESPGWCAFTGQSPDQAVGLHWLNAVHPYDRDLALNVWRRSVKQKAPFEIEYRIRRSDGIYVWHQVRGNAVLEDDGSVREWVTVCVDINDRKRATEQRELLYRSVEQALDLIVSVSTVASAAQTTTALASDSLARICIAQRWQFAQAWCPDPHTGRLSSLPAAVWNSDQFADFRRLSIDTEIDPGDDLPGRVYDIKTATWFEDIGFGDFPRLRPALKAGLRTAMVFPVVLGDEVMAVFEFLSNDPREPDRTALRAVDQLGRILGDIWARKRSEAALRASEQRWRSVFEMSSLGVSLTDENLRFVATNRALQKMLGYSAEELQRLSPIDLMIEEEHPPAKRRLEELRQGDRASYEAITRYRRKDGELIWVNSFVSTIPGDGNRAPIYLATAIDITARHKAESDLRRTATYLAEAEKLSHTGCWARNISSGELFWSPEEWRIFGLDPATTKITYATLLDLIHPEDRAPFEEANARSVRDRKPYNISYRAVLRDGMVKHIHTVGNPVFDSSGALVEFVGVSMDETERIRANAAVQEAQAELARVARLTSMGELAASIAHEINQPLAAVVANGNAALRWLDRAKPDLDEAKDALQDVIKEGNRASDVIGRIRSFLRHHKPDYIALDINDAIRETLALTANTLSARHVTVQKHLPDNIPPVLGDRVQLQQVVMNLIMNGADAMSSVKGRSRLLRVESQVEGSNVLVTVKDSGTGIDQAIFKRIFDPLFTTKSTGMGMGLPICRSIVETHGGLLSVSPASPYGAAFHFTIPIAAAASRRTPRDRKLARQ